MRSVVVYLRDSVSGQIFYVGQSGEDDTSTFISCGVRNGTVSLDSRLGGKHIHQLRGRRKVDDNIQHLVEVKRHDNNFTLYLDGSKEGQILIAHPFAHPLIADKIVLGGEDLLMEFNQSEKALFKGTLQDVRINEKNLVLSESLPSFLKLNQSVGVQMLRQNLLMVDLHSKHLKNDLGNCIRRSLCQKALRPRILH